MHLSVIVFLCYKIKNVSVIFILIVEYAKQTILSVQ